MRLPDIDTDHLTPEQQELYDALSSRPEVQRHGLVGPFGMMMHAPEMGIAMAALGKAIRFTASLPAQVTEVAICSVGAYYRAAFEFAAHRAMALQAGVDEAALDALAAGDDPGFGGDTAVAHAVAMELLAEHRITDATYAEAVERFGPQGVTELVVTIGYYSLVSLMLNGFEADLVDGMDDPFA
jgi:4-carboxymuconolactone decarboxylase